MDSSAQPAFSFVNISHPHELKDEETQLRVRRFAMSKVGRARRKPKTRKERNELVLDFRIPAPEPTAIERLGGGEIDPFTPYPIDLDETSRGLVAFSRCSAADPNLDYAPWCLSYVELHSLSKQ
jgi:hypothetical protein